MKTLSTIYKTLCAELSELEARMILKERAGVEWVDIIGDPEREIDTALIEADLNAMKSGKPLSRIYGKREFWGLEFEINEHTLDPRPDSETLIEAALKHYNRQIPEMILDLGTGSGCLLLALLSEFQNAQGIGIDLSQGAIKTAQKNAANLKLHDRATFQTGSWAAEIDQKFDLIVANPPYIRSNVIPTLDENVKNHDPILALDGGESGLQAYDEIFSDLFRILKPDGLALFEIGFDQADDMMRLSEKHGLKLGDIYPDLSGNPRVVEIFLK